MTCASGSAILASGRFRVWSFTWHDVDWHRGQEQSLPPWIGADQARGQAREAAGKVGGDALVKVMRLALESDPIKALFGYLAEPSEARWQLAASLAGLALLNAPYVESSESLIESLVRVYRESEDPRPAVPEAPARAGDHRPGDAVVVGGRLPDPGRQHRRGEPAR
jgi:hypothetical protein